MMASTPLTLGLLLSAALIALLAIGVPVAFALGGLALGILVWQEGWASLIPASDSLLGALQDFTLVAVPLFILMGVAASLSRAGADMREMIKRWQRPSQIYRSRDVKALAEADRFHGSIQQVHEHARGQ